MLVLLLRDSFVLYDDGVCTFPISCWGFFPFVFFFLEDCALESLSHLDASGWSFFSENRFSFQGWKYKQASFFFFFFLSGVGARKACSILFSFEDVL